MWTLEQLERYNKILDDLYEKAENKNPVSKAEDEFDFLKIAYARLLKQFGKNSDVQIREVYRICALLFTFDKQTTRALLRALDKRKEIAYFSDYVRIL